MVAIVREVECLQYEGLKVVDDWSMKMRDLSLQNYLVVAFVSDCKYPLPIVAASADLCTGGSVTYVPVLPRSAAVLHW